MIDIHTHILPGIDDGAIDMEESVEMAIMAAESGVEYIVATPHCNIPGFVENYLDDRFVEVIREFKAAVSEVDIPINILVGMEVFATPELPKLLMDNRIVTLNGGKYFLTEFAFDEDLEFCDIILDQCARVGYVPVIAHPERYSFIQENPEHVAKWIHKGYAVQINKGSIQGKFGRTARRIANILLQRRMVTCVASDAHSSYRRTPHMREIYEYLSYEYGAEYAEQLLYDNPLKILKSEEL